MLPGRQARERKPSIKEKFQEFMTRRKIMNSKHYDIVLAASPYLRKLKNMMPPPAIESVKKNMYNQNMYIEPEPYLNRTSLKDSESLSERVIEKAFDVWMGKLADDNGMSKEECIGNIVNVLMLADSKISTLAFIGESNSGKTLLSKLLRCVYKSYECGIIQSCPRRHVSDLY